MQKNKLKVIIDTNVFMTFLITRKANKLDDLLENQMLKFVYCEELLTELMAVINRPKLKPFFAEKDLQKLLVQMKIFGSFSIVKTKVTACRDPKEDFFLSLAKQTKSDYIITVNKDLLMLENFEGTKIISMNDFLKEL